MAMNKQDWFNKGNEDRKAGIVAKAACLYEKQRQSVLSWQESAYLKGYGEYPVIIDYKPEIAMSGPLPDVDKFLPLEKALKGLNDVAKEMKEMSAAFLSAYAHKRKFGSVMQSFAKSPDAYKTAIHHIDQLWRMACDETDPKRKNRLLNKMEKLSAKWE